MRHNPALDGLRAFSAFAVVAMHSRVPGMSGGALGVDVFFVLSGYLITSILRAELADTGRIDLWRFYTDRAIRLCPPLILMVGTWALVVRALVPEAETGWQAVAALLYLTDYVAAFTEFFGHFGHTWSLAVEEHFYMVWPLALIALARVPAGRLARVLLFGVLVAAVWRSLDFAVWQDWRRTIYRFDTNAAGLVLGGAIAVIPWRPGVRGASRLGLGAALALLAMLPVYEQSSPMGIMLGAPVATVAAGCLVLSLGVPGTPVYRLLCLRPLVYLGWLSYSVYLWHYPIAIVMRESAPGLATFAVTAVLSTALACLSFELVERPLRDWRRARGRPGAPTLMEGRLPAG